MDAKGWELQWVGQPRTLNGNNNYIESISQLAEVATARRLRLCPETPSQCSKPRKSALRSIPPFVVQLRGFPGRS